MSETIPTVAGDGSIVAGLYRVGDPVEDTSYDPVNGSVGCGSDRVMDMGTSWVGGCTLS